LVRVGTGRRGPGLVDLELWRWVGWRLVARAFAVVPPLTRTL
jgi:hypothetical protein